MKYELPKTSYGYDALEPYIDAKTMEVHYTKHHQTYVNKLNEALEKHPEIADKSLEHYLAIWTPCRMISALRCAIMAAVTGIILSFGRSWPAILEWRRCPTGRSAWCADRKHIREFQYIQRGIFKISGVGVWLRLGMACGGRRRKACDNDDGESGQPDREKTETAARARRLGARLLPEISKQASGLHRRLVERGGLGGGG